MREDMHAGAVGRPRLGVAVVSTRPGRVGLPVARRFEDAARRHGGFDVDRIDLAELGLRLPDEPNHPRLGQHTQAHTRRWSAHVDGADAFVFVVPEYNFSMVSMAASLKNALGYLFWEWQDQPVGFVSYGGVSARTGGVQMTKEVVTALKMMPLPEAVSIPFVRQSLDDRGELVPNDVMESAATAMLDELRRWEEALWDLRRGARAFEPVAR